MAKKSALGVSNFTKKTRKKRPGRWFKAKRKGYTRKRRIGQGKPR